MSLVFRLALAAATLVAAAATPCAAQPALSVAAGVRRLGTPAPVTVAGRASVGTDALMRRAVYVAIQDDVAGLWVFSKSVEAQVRAGDSVVVTGLVHRYRGMVELVADSVRVVPAAPRVPTPVPLPAAGAAVAAHEGQLVRVRGTAGAHGVSEGGRWMRLHARHAGPPDSVTLWVGPTHADPPQLADVVAGDQLEVTGVAAAYRDNPGDAHVWQVVPRSPADVSLIGISRRWYTLAARVAALAAAVGAVIALAARALTRRHARALAETDARYRQLLELSPDAVLVHAAGRVLFANPAAARLLGVADEHALSGRPLDDFAPAEERALLATAAPPGGGQRVRTRFVGAGGAPVDVEAATSPCRYHDRDAAVIVARDIGAQLRYERELRELALLDEMTGLHNRRGFLTFADGELRRTWQAGRGAVLAFADLDGLKRINDEHGHAAGDTALCVVARALRETAGGEGLVARWGGDEFVALLADAGGATSGGAALEGADSPDAFERRLADAIARQSPPGLPFQVQASVGLRRVDPDAGESLAELLAGADSGLYRRKARGRTGATEPAGA